MNQCVGRQYHMQPPECPRCGSIRTRKLNKQGYSHWVCKSCNARNAKARYQLLNEQERRGIYQTRKSYVDGWVSSNIDKVRELQRARYHRVKCLKGNSERAAKADSFAYCKNLVGKRFGSVAVIDHSHRSRQHHWVCVCDCGHLSIKTTKGLKNDGCRSCAYVSMRKYTGQSHEERVKQCRESRKETSNKKARDKRATDLNFAAKCVAISKSYKDRLADGYVRSLIRAQIGIDSSISIPTTLIEAKKSELKVRRLINRKKD